MAKNSAKPEAINPNDGLDLAALAELESGLVSDQIGFPPYWNPSEGKKFYGRVVARDERDPDFIRYVIEAGVRHQCQEGPSDEARPVTVDRGQHFNVSVYASLPLENYFGETVLVTALRKRDIDGGKQVWIFDLKTTETGRSHAAQLRAAKLNNTPALPVASAEA